MSTDRELLELAAKAAGVTGWFENDSPDASIFYDDQNNKSVYGIWNPLTDDGDALRLAVKLRIHLADFPDTVVPSRGVGWRQGQAHLSLWEPEGNDAAAATRRAITRAAAEIGRSMNRSE